MGHNRGRRHYKTGRQRPKLAMLRTYLPNEEEHNIPAQKVDVALRMGLPREQHNYIKAKQWLEENGGFTLAFGFNRLVFNHDATCGLRNACLCDCQPAVVLNGKHLKYPVSALGALAPKHSNGNGSHA